jgi:arylsulfatase A-like enzyme
MLGRKLSERFLPSRLAWWYRSRITAHGRSYLLAEEVTELALRWLEPRRHRPFFLFLNYMDPHAPYLPVRGYRDLFPQADSPQILDRARIESGERAILDRERGPLVDGYDAELRYLDDQLHRLFVRLAEWEQLDHTLVVIVGDHGESFGEHFELEHATGLHEPQLRVPLILRRPGQRSGSRVARPVHLVDVMPTILAETGLEPPPGLQGMSLFEEGPRPYPVTAHLGRYRRDYVESAIYSHPWKLIVSSAGEVELYDLQADPIESVNLAPEHPHLVRELSRELEGFKREVGPRFDPDSRPLDSETLEALRSLGYVD